jgi:DNA-binding NarL/FixJ family response regulator
VVSSLRPQNDREWAAASKFIAAMATGFHADSHEVAEVASAIQQACDYQQYNAYMDAPADVDLTDVLPALTAPTLVLHIPDMVLTTYEDSREVAERIKDALLVEYDPPHTFSTLFNFLREAKQPASAATERGITLMLLKPGSSMLTAREIEVLRLLALGKSNVEIAKELVISRSTVQNHVSNIFTKINAANRTEAAIFARERGIA